MSRRKEIEAEIAKLQAELDGLPNNEPVAGMLCWFTNDGVDATIGLYERRAEPNPYDFKHMDANQKPWVTCGPAPTPWIKVVDGKAPEWDGEIIVRLFGGEVEIWPSKDRSWMAVSHWMPNILEEGE